MAVMNQRRRDASRGKQLGCEDLWAAQITRWITLGRLYFIPTKSICSTPATSLSTYKRHAHLFAGFRAAANLAFWRAPFRLTVLLGGSCGIALMNILLQPRITPSLPLFFFQPLSVEPVIGWCFSVVLATSMTEPTKLITHRDRLSYLCCYIVQALAAVVLGLMISSAGFWGGCQINVHSNLDYKCFVCERNLVVASKFSARVEYRSSMRTLSAKRCFSLATYFARLLTRGLFNFSSTEIIVGTSMAWRAGEVGEADARHLRTVRGPCKD